MKTDRLPPQDLESERRLLGACFDHRSEHSDLDLDVIRTTVSPEMFYTPQHGDVFQAILDCADADEPIDVATILPRLGTAEGNGEWKETISDIINEGEPANTLFYARQIFEAWKKREGIARLSRALEDLYNPRPDVLADDVFAGLKLPAAPRGRELAFRAYSDIDDKSITWLWPDRIPAGMLSLLAGLGGQGKSLLALDMASRISVGRPWPDRRDKRNPQGDTIIISCEDDPQCTIGPRLTEAGADRTRIRQLVDDFDLVQDIDALRHDLKANPAVKLVVIDPLSAYLGTKTDSWKDDHVRRVLRPVAELACHTGVAFIGICHLNKHAKVNAAVERLVGSVAFANAARAVWMALSDPSEPGRKLLLRVKCNLGPPMPGLAYRVVGNPATGYPHIEWEAEPVDLSADEIMAPTRQRTVRDDVKDWLAGFLSHGPRNVDVCVQEAERKGYTGRTLQRAKRDLGVVHARKAQTWSLPQSNGSP